MRKSIFTRFFAAKYAMAGLLLFGGIAASFAMKAAISAAVAEELVATAITPDPAASGSGRSAREEDRRGEHRLGLF